LSKPLAGTEPHGGGDLLSSGADDALIQKFLDWF
jgi:hypothetical protein